MEKGSAIHPKNYKKQVKVRQKWPNLGKNVKLRHNSGHLNAFGAARSKTAFM